MRDVILLFMNFDIIYIIIVIVVILVSMTFHEAMHAYVGYWLGDNTAKVHGRLSFNPIKHIDPFMTILLPVMLAIADAPIFGGAKPVPFNPHNLRLGEWGPALIAIAGPITNLLISFIAFGVWVLIDPSTQGILWQIFRITVFVNLGFFIFNMIPIPPLDGSRVIYALAPEFVRRGMESVERFGIIVVFMILLLLGSVFETFLATSINFFILIFTRIFGL